MPTKIEPVEFAYRWNEGGTFLALCSFFDRSPASCLAYAGTLRHKGHELRHRPEEVTDERNNVYLPSQEQIRIDCLKIREKRGMTPRTAFHTELSHPDGKNYRHYPKREINERVSIKKLLKSHRKLDPYSDEV